MAVVVVIAAIATVGGRAVPVIGAPVIGIVLGVLLNPVLGQRGWMRPAIDVASARVLQLAVVVLGAQLSLREVVQVGVGSLPVMVGTLISCLLVAFVVGRRLGIGGDLRTLIGVGTGVCGASAIAAVSPLIRARSTDIAYAISTIFLFNVAAVLTFPALGHLLGLSQQSFGLFAGTAVNDTSSVVAAATSYGTQAGNHAVVVKLTRTLMIIPISIGISALARRRQAEQTKALRSERPGPAAMCGSDGPASISALPASRPAPAGPGASVPEKSLVTGRPHAESSERPHAATSEQPHAAIRALRLVPWFLIGFLIVAGVNTAGLIPASGHDAVQNAALFLITVALSGIGLSTDYVRLRRAGVRPLLLGLVLWVTVATTSLLLQAVTR